MIPIFSKWLKPTIVMATSGSLLLMATALANPDADVLAQSPTNTPRPTPTNVGGRPDEDGDGPGAVVPGQNSGVSGIVYNFSNNASPSPDTIVVIEGGGWSQETVTDSNGRYFFAGLGSGSAVLNLRLPAGEHPAAPNWPIYVNGDTNVEVNLGYFWGDARPLPIVLRSTADPAKAPVGSQVTLSFEVENLTSEMATTGLVDVKLPPELQAIDARASQGSLDFSPRRVRLGLGDLPADATATLQVQATVLDIARPDGGLVQAVSADTTAPTALVYSAFTYDQMIVPQAIHTGILTLEGKPARPPVPASNAAPVQTAPAQTTPDLPTTGGVASPEPTAPAANSAQAEAAPTATPAPNAPASAPAADSQESDTDSLIPATGQTQPTASTTALWAAAILLVGLAAAGLNALRSRRADY